MPTTELPVDLHLETHPYPLVPDAQQELIQLLRTEWNRTDYDWLEAMNGDYGSNLAITSIVARRRGEAVATATVHHHRTCPEAAVLGGVLTRRQHRGHGIGGRVVAAALAVAQRAGCVLCLLGTAKSPTNLYSRNGFDWIRGSVMRRALTPADAVPDIFAPEQATTLRAADWGDLPGLTLLAAQPLATACLDFPRGLFSSRYVSPERCLSNFPVLWYDTVVRGGALQVVEGAQAGRVLGFGSISRGAGSGRRHTGTIDLCLHDAHVHLQPELLASLLDQCRVLGLSQVDAWVAGLDEAKQDCLRDAGFVEQARLPSALVVDEEPVAAVLLGREL